MALGAQVTFDKPTPQNYGYIAKPRDGHTGGYELPESLKIISSNTSLSGRLWQTEGEWTDDSFSDYYPSSLIPNLADLQGASPFPEEDSDKITPPRHALVTVVKIDDAMVELILRTYLGGGRQPSPDHKGAVVHAVAESLSDCFSLGGDLQILGLATHAPGQLTVTRRTPADRKIGLHVDSWDQHKSEGRAESRNRLCINLGSQPRLFCFGDQLLSNYTLDSRITNLGRFLCEETFRAGRFFALKVDPGFAYVAPTENIVHDGSTLFQSEPDLSFTLIGNIALNSTRDG